MSFGIIGSIGFIVDSSILMYLVNIENMGIVVSRFISFPSAVFITWLLNRIFTFTTDNVKVKKFKEYLLYLLIQTIGAAINFSIFFALIYLFKPLETILILPLAIGAICSLIFNFLVIKKKVYQYE